MGAFVIKGSNDSKYAVTLFPNETCQCPSTTECYHIIAAKKAIGMSTESRSKLNFTELRKRSRKRVDKKSGRKRPRLNDINIDVSAAPDSRLFETDHINISGISHLPPTRVTSTPQTTKTLSTTNNNSAMKSVTKHKETIVKTVHFDNCHSKHTSDFFDMEDDRPTDVNFWIPDLQLTQSDKDILLKSDGWLKSTHMEAINKIAQKQFPAMNGLQLTERVPLLSEDIWTTHSPLNTLTHFRLVKSTTMGKTTGSHH